jgi:uncharacterized protein (DUF433 family)
MIGGRPHARQARDRDGRRQAARHLRGAGHRELGEGLPAVDLVRPSGPPVASTGVMSGQPIIRGLRITVKDVLGFLASGMTIAAILHDFSELEAADIYTALACAAENLSDSSAA